MGVRFAPSPTGRFHLGNLRTAWISWVWAKRLGLPWVIRFEDIDTPRVLPHAQEGQLKDMASLGLVPDRQLVQSRFQERHWQVFEKARAAGQVYPCFCSRKEVQEALEGLASAPHVELPVYSGRCRDRDSRPCVASHPTIAWRFKMPRRDGSRDFIVARTNSTGDERASFVPAYHWACAIDDFDGAYDLLVRAWDLAHVVPQHRAIHAWLATERFRPFPAVFHCALVTGKEGERLEKRTEGVTLPELFAQGLSSENIVGRFEKSFSGPFDYSPEKVWGERKIEISVSEVLRSPY